MFARAASGVPEPDERASGSGTVLGGRYALTSVLGRGGMATVWRAQDRRLHRDVAVKVFDSGGALPDAPARVAAEVRLLAGLAHPGLVAVHDAGADGGDDGFDFLVMELVDGETLRARLDRGPMPPPEVAAIGAQLAEALGYVHERGVVHRDVKPANILLARGSRGEHAKLTDFGVARILRNDRMTLHGTTLGTANYLSPEQATGADVSGPSDVYSLGLVLTECLTGRIGYDGHGVEAAAARLHRPPAGLADVPSAWRDLLTAMTSLRPADRPDVAAVTRRLTQLAADPNATTALVGTAVAPAADTSTRVFAAAPAGTTGTAGTADTAAASTDDEPRRRGLLLPLLGAVAVLAVVAVVVISLLQSSGTSTTPGQDRGTSPAAALSTSPTASPSTSSTGSPRPVSSTASRPAASRSASSVQPIGATAAPGPGPATAPQVPPGQAKKTEDPGPGKQKGPGKH